MKQDVQQFVLAYEVEQDRLRAMLPDGFDSLRPVLRLNAEIRNEGAEMYLELNTPVHAHGKRGWLNIAHWDDMSIRREAERVSFSTPFLELHFERTGTEGGCPAEQDNEGCFFIGDGLTFRPAENITEHKMYCNAIFRWRFQPGDAAGRSIPGKTLPASYKPVAAIYPAMPLRAESAASIPCRQVLGAYAVRFIR